MSELKAVQESLTGGEGILRVFQSKNETRAFYNKISGIYDLMAEHSEGPVRAAGIALLAAREGERILEIGFGTGHSLVVLAEQVGPTGQVDGIDLSEGMLAQAKKQIDGHPAMTGRISLACGDASKLPYESESMDGVFMSFTLELFDTPEIPVVLAECRRVLKPNGRLVVVAMSKEGEPGFLIDAFEWTHRHFPNYLDCRPIFAAAAVEAAGFRDIEKRKMTMWIPVEIVLGRN